MPSLHWLKLWHEALDDPKMQRLPDRLYRRFVEMLLFAGKEGRDGELPSVADMVWTLRSTLAELFAYTKHTGKPFAPDWARKNGHKVCADCIYVCCIGGFVYCDLRHCFRDPATWCDGYTEAQP